MSITWVNLSLPLSRLFNTESFRKRCLSHGMIPNISYFQFKDSHLEKKSGLVLKLVRFLL